MSGDDLGLFTDEEPAYQPGKFRRKQKRVVRQRVRRRRQRQVITAVVVIIVLIGVAAGAWYGITQLLGIGNSYADFSGNGESDVVVQVQDEDVISTIAGRMAAAGVVASPKAFTSAAADNSQALGVQPGFYLMKTKMSGSAAVTRLVDPKSQVGQFQIKGGQQLADTIAGATKKVPGVLSLIAKATCAQVNGQQTCVSVDDLEQTEENADLAGLGVPDWAIPAASKAEKKRRLEGLIVPGVYNVKPGWTAQEVMHEVVSRSAQHLQAIGMPNLAAETGFSPYEVLIIGGLLEKESINKDFGKISRVIYNRLAQSVPLGLDSTINYPLERQNIRTTDEDRARSGVYNTYLVHGLPPTPIATVGEAALKAASKPEPGSWLYFVKCQNDGTSCFSSTQAEQDAAAHDAMVRGVY